MAGTKEEEEEQAVCALKPCPFCGGKGHMTSREARYLGKDKFGAKKIKVAVQVICGRCKARGGVVTGIVILGSIEEQRKCLEPLKKKTVELWNRRAKE